jgi:hypothetical protein
MDKQRWIERKVAAIDECQDANQVFDVDNDYYARVYLLNVPLTITSARSRPSDCRPGKRFAQIGFLKADGSDGQFNIGGNAAWLPLRLQRTGQLPARMILRLVGTNRGQVWKWERV